MPEVFSQTVAAHLEDRTVSAALLCFMDFRNAPRRWWTGFGTLDAGGHEWQGTGALISIDGLATSGGTVAAATTFTLSGPGVDADIAAQARAGSEQVKGRRAVVYMQFFVAEPLNGQQQVGELLDEPVSVWTGEMDQVRFAADGPNMRTITVTAENRWANRNRPPFGLYTYHDQQARFPGDEGLSEIGSLANKTIHWPDF